MRQSIGSYGKVMHIFFTLALSVALAACGGGGGTSSTSPGVSGPATVGVSIASAPGFPAGTTFAPSILSPATAAPANSPDFDNVFVTVTKLALIPSTGLEYPDRDGEVEAMNHPDEDGKSGMRGFVTATLTEPVVVDLLHLTGKGREVADNVLNKFSEVPAGEYSKIRVYYSSVVGHSNSAGDTKFHPTANYHFDVHFVGGNLVIPVTSAPEDGIRFYSVVINVVGLKYHQAGQSANVLLRPQVFAMVEGPPEYIVSGVAMGVTRGENFDGTFDILTPGGRTIPAEFFGPSTTKPTFWAYSDNVLQGSHMILDVNRTVAVPAFDNLAEVSAIGVFDTGGRLQASYITFTFPHFRIGKIFSTWSADNTYFRLDRPLPLDNLVYAIPDKLNPLYTDFRVPPVELANGYNLIVPNADNTVKARGYSYTDIQGPGLRAFWISIDNNIGP